MRPSAALACALLLALPAAARGQAVTFQGGPTHDGHAGRAALDLPLQRAWSVTVDGLPSYAVIGGGRVFVTVSPRSLHGRGSHRLLALSARDGRLLWSRDLGVAATPAYDGSTVFAARSSYPDPGAVWAFDGASGRRLWEASGSGYATPPVAAGGAVYARINGTITALRQSDGAPIWSHNPGNGTDGAFAVTSDAVYATLPCENTLALRRGDGALLWETQRRCHGGGGTTAVVAAGRLFARNYADHPWPGEVLAAADGRSLGRWRTDHAPAVAGNTAVFADASRGDEWLRFGVTLAARSLPSGRVRWRFRGDGYLDTPPLIAGGTVYAGSGSGRLYGISLRSGRVRWRASIGTPVNGSEWNNPVGGLAAADGMLVVPGYRRVVAFR